MYKKFLERIFIEENSVQLATLRIISAWDHVGGESGARWISWVVHPDVKSYYFDFDRGLLSRPYDLVFWSMDSCSLPWDGRLLTAVNNVPFDHQTNCFSEKLLFCCSLFYAEDDLLTSETLLQFKLQNFNMIWKIRSNMYINTHWMLLISTVLQRMFTPMHWNWNFWPIWNIMKLLVFR